MTTIQGPGRSAFTPLTHRNERMTTPEDGKPVFRRDTKTALQESIRESGADPVAARRDGVPGPGHSRQQGRNQVVNTAYAVGNVIDLAEGTVRQLLGRHHGGMFNPTGRRIPDMPPNQPINVRYDSPSMLRFVTPPQLEVPQPQPQAPQVLPVMPVMQPVPSAIPQTVPGTSRPTASRLEVAEMVRTKSVDPS